MSIARGDRFGDTDYASCAGERISVVVFAHQGFALCCTDPR